MNIDRTASLGTRTAAGVFNRIMVACADRTSAIALALPSNPTSGDILRALTLAYAAGADQALAATETLRTSSELSQIRLSSSRRS